ncbi:hypothetical protein JKP88DRAFT_270240 [Tribonema minus]|uniref:Uncharacterized protein n=1 Tax=Tribonema minus TaxID=303371 RepID=A0A835YSF5_9STRA|nr:hypothetical protein JKP88DRAFT_270240 [Tribonema minus]
MLHVAQPNAQMYFSGDYQAPLFERVSHDDVAELHACHAQLTELEARCGDLERINVDLELRLERQAKERMTVDREIAESNQAWEARLLAAATEAAEARSKLENEVRLGDIARDKLRRTERELHRILQKKYDIVRTAKLEERNAAKDRTRIAADLARQAEMLNGGTGGGSGSGGVKFTTNPLGGGPVAVRERRVVNSLSDFFCL